MEEGALGVYQVGEDEAGRNKSVKESAAEFPQRQSVSGTYQICYSGLSTLLM